MNYDELKEIITRHGFIIDRYEDNWYSCKLSLYIHANNTMFDETDCNDIFATAKFGMEHKLISIKWFDKISVSNDSLVFDEDKTGMDFYLNKDFIQKIEKRFGCVQKDIKKASIKLKLKEINKDFYCK